MKTGRKEIDGMTSRETQTFAERNLAPLRADGSARAIVSRTEYEDGDEVWTAEQDGEFVIDYRVRSRQLSPERGRDLFVKICGMIGEAVMQETEARKAINRVVCQ